jgi:hypothetical protein
VLCITLHLHTEHPGEVDDTKPEFDPLARGVLSSLQAPLVSALGKQVLCLWNDVPAPYVQSFKQSLRGMQRHNKARAKQESNIAKHGQTEAKTCELISLHGCTLARLRNFVFLLRFAAGVCSSSLFYIVALFDQTSFAKLLSVGLFCCERNPSHVVYLIWKRI